MHQYDSNQECSYERKKGNFKHTILGERQEISILGRQIFFIFTDYNMACAMIAIAKHFWFLRIYCTLAYYTVRLFFSYFHLVVIETNCYSHFERSKHCRHSHSKSKSKNITQIKNVACLDFILVLVLFYP